VAFHNATNSHPCINSYHRSQAPLTPDVGDVVSVPTVPILGAENGKGLVDTMPRLVMFPVSSLVLLTISGLVVVTLLAVVIVTVSRLVAVTVCGLVVVTVVAVVQTSK